MHQLSAPKLYAGIVLLLTVPCTQMVWAQSTYNQQTLRETRDMIETRKLQWQYPSYSSSGSSSSYYPSSNLANVPSLREIFGIKRKPKVSALDKAKAAGDYNKVMKILKERADKGDAQACYELGAEKDTDETTGFINSYSEQWYHFAANKGHGEAMYALSRPYRVPFGVPRNSILEGRKWLEKAAYARYPEAVADLKRYNTDPVVKAAMDRVLQYDYIGRYENGLKIAIARRKGKSGFIDQWGNEVVPARFDHVSHFFGGMAVIKADGKYGYVTPEGAYINPVFDSAGYFSDQLATVWLDGKAGVIDKEGEVIVPFKYDLVGDFNEGFAAVHLNGKWGFIDRQGKELIPLVYDGAYRFSEGLAAVNKGGVYTRVNTHSWKTEGGKWGFINTRGTEVIPLQYDEVIRYARFHNGTVSVRKGKKWIKIDKEGKPSKY